MKTQDRWAEHKRNKTCPVNHVWLRTPGNKRIIITTKEQEAFSLRVEAERRTQCRGSSVVSVPAAAARMASDSHRSADWGKPWMNYCTLQLFYSQIWKIVNIMNLFLCTMCITIELWSSVENKGFTPSCVLLDFCCFLVSVEPRMRTTIYLPNICLTAGADEGFLGPKH